MYVAILALSSTIAPAVAQSTPSNPGTDPGTSSPSDGGKTKTDTAVPAYVEYEKKVRAAEQMTPLGSDMFGDSVSPYLGQTEFNVVDIDLPGNNALPVQLRRRFAVSLLTKDSLKDPNGGIGNPYGGIGNWDVEVPYIYGTFDADKKWNKTLSGYTGRCSTPFVPDVVTGFEATEIWSGNKIHIPGQGDLGMLGLEPTWPPMQAQADGQSHRWTTSRFDSFTCKPTSNGAFGEGFVMTTAEGVSYAFDVYVERSYPTVRHNNTATGSNRRVMIFLLASQVTDRHGNWVKYSYNCASEKCAGHPEKIESNDGRKITLTYNPTDASQLQKAEVTQGSPAETRTWQYAYRNSPNDTYPQLFSVTLPDNSQWQYTYSNTDYLYVTYTEEVDPSGLRCQDPFRSTGGDFTLGITHPSGSQGSFRFGLTRHKRNLPSFPPNCNTGRYSVPPYVDTFSLVSKTITDGVTPGSTWQYSYGIDFCPQDGCTSATNRVLQPDGSVVDSVYSTTHNATGRYAPVGSAIEGQLLRTDYKTTPNGALLRSEIYQYITGKDVDGQPFTGQLFPSRYGSVYGADDEASGSVRPLKSTTVLLRLPTETGISTQDITFTQMNDTFDSFARPLQVTSVSALGYTRTETTAYQDYPGKWILGLVKSVTEQSTGLVRVLNGYDPSTANLTSVTEFGVPKRSMSYRSSTTTNIDSGVAGTLWIVNDGLNATVLNAFKRGIPGSVTYADGYSQSATISDFGEITSVTDENGATTQYQYDPVGRLRRIKYPTGDTPAWADTTIDYLQVAGAEMGITGSHWRRTQTTGNATKITYFDQRLRPVVTQEYDVAKLGETRRYTARSFDYANRETFASYPSLTFYPSAGMGTEYDTIGRVKKVTQDGEPALGPIVTTTEYFAPFTKKVTDPNGNWTKATFKAFDTPSEDAPNTIITSAGVTTGIGRDIFNKPQYVERHDNYGTAPVSLIRSYVYDSGQRLCKTIELETGATVQDYDAAGNVSWSTKGSSSTGSTCDRNNVPAADRTTYKYDKRNRLWSTTFPDGTPSIDQTYWPDGALKTTSSNGAVWTYDYNQRRLLQSESLAYNGQDFLLEWSYDANGSINQLAYPDDSIVNFMPNALGQPTRAGDYATNVTYFANGAMKGFTYGNGIVHSLTQNERQLPLRSNDGAATDLTYRYDKNANVLAITDGLSPAVESRTMGYDGLNRLMTASAPGMWGNATFTYDRLDNLIKSTVGIRDCTHTFNAANRLESVSGTNCDAISYGYDARGNVTSRGSQAFIFDRADRMTAAVGKEGYVYDGLGRRVRITRNAGGTLQFQYQVYSKEGQLLFGLDPATGKSTNYVYLNGSLVARNESSPTSAGPPPPPAPTVAPSPSTDGAYTVSWNAVPGATSYALAEVANGAAEVTYPINSPSPGAPVPLTWPTSGRPNGSYVYRVQACTTICGGYSGTTTEVVQIRTGSLTASPNPSDTGTYTVSWPAVPGAASYVLLENGIPRSDYNGTALSWSSPSRPDGDYVYQLQTCSGTCGAPGPSVTETVKTGTPGQLGATPNPALVGTTYVVSWNQVTSAVSYRLEESSDFGVTWREIQRSLNRTSSISGKPAGTYLYRVRACRVANDDTYCGTFQAQLDYLKVSVREVVPPIPDPPAWLRSDPETSTDGRYTVSWAESNYATSYKLQEMYCYGDPREFCESAWRSLTLTPGQISARAWSPPTPKTGYGKYRYQVQACNSRDECSPWKGPWVTLVNLPNVLPGDTRISSITPNPSRDGNYTISWPPAARATYYTLRENSSGTNWVDLPDLPTGTSWSPPTPKPNGSYYYLLRACNVYGCTPFNPTTTYSEARVDIPTSQPMTPPTLTIIGGTGVYPAPATKIRWSLVPGATTYNLKEEVSNCNRPPNERISIDALPANTVQPVKIEGRLMICGGRELNPSIYWYSMQACKENGTICSDWTPTVEVRISGTAGRPASSGTTTYIHTDGLRSPVAETNQSGAVTSRTRYEPYGAPTTGVYVQGPGYTGHVTDAATGLSYMQQRYYDPMAGRFLSTDPVLASPGSFNRYAYAQNNPYKYIDPDGRYSCIGSKSDCGLLADAMGKLAQASANGSLSQGQQKSLNAVQAFYGKPEEKNGVTVMIGDKGSLSGSVGGTSTQGKEASVGIRADTIADNSGGKGTQKFQERLAGVVAHEGEHGVDQKVNGMPRDRATEKAGEIRAATTESALYQGLNSNFGPWLWTPERGPQPNGIERAAENATNLWCQSPGSNCK